MILHLSQRPSSAEQLVATGQEIRYPGGASVGQRALEGHLSAPSPIGWARRIAIVSKWIEGAGNFVAVEWAPRGDGLATGELLESSRQATFVTCALCGQHLTGDDVCFGVGRGPHLLTMSATPSAHRPEQRGGTEPLDGESRTSRVLIGRTPAIRGSRACSTWGKWLATASCRSCLRVGRPARHTGDDVSLTVARPLLGDSCEKRRWRDQYSYDG
jgi:hypothetical protein